MKRAKLRSIRETHRSWANYQKVTDRFTQYALLIRLNRPIGIYLLLWPTLWALWIAADGKPDPWILFVFVAGVVLMRSAGCAINDFADRNIDPLVKRTRRRPLASGKISATEAVLIFVLLSLAAFVLVLTLNTLTIALSVVGVMLAASYPFMKRFHHLPQVHLGAAFGWAVPMAFAAHTGEFPPPVAWLLFIATLLWATAYDTMYAMADREEDMNIGVKSTAILFGQADRAIIGLLQALIFIDLLIIAHITQFGEYFYLGLIAAMGFAFYQQKLLATHKAENCFRAFLNNNYFGMSVFTGMVLDYLI